MVASQAKTIVPNSVYVMCLLGSAKLAVLTL